MSAPRYLVFGSLVLLAIGCQVDQSLGDIGEAGGEAGDASGGSDTMGGASGSSGSGGATSGGSTAGGASSGGAGTNGGTGSGASENGGSGPGGSSGDEVFSVVTADGYQTPPPACEGELPRDGWCIGAEGETPSPLDCAVPDEVISFVANDDANCPFCAAPPAGSVTRACPDARAIYAEFVWDLVSSSCANSCESDADCFALEVVNACGDFVVSLRGDLDEEPIGFMEEYAATHCGACGMIDQETYLRRPGSSRIEYGAPMGSLLEGFESRCVERQCVLVRY